MRVTLVEDEGPQPPPLVEEEHPTPRLRVGSWLKGGLSPPAPALRATNRTRTPKSASSTSTSSACRLLGWI